MKTVKKLLALTLVMLMVFALAGNASAAGSYPKKDIYVVCPGVPAAALTPACALSARPWVKSWAST